MKELIVAVAIITAALAAMFSNQVCVIASNVCK